MKKYEFEVEREDTYFNIRCYEGDNYFKIIINTWDDPYEVYYGGLDLITADEEGNFRDQLFNYLRSEYPDCFSNYISLA